MHHPSQLLRPEDAIPKVSFLCRKKKGAVLSLPVPAKMENTVASADLAGGYLNISTAGSYGPDTLDWELTGWRTLFLSLELIAQDLGLMLFFLVARTVDKHHSRRRWTITVILLTLTGKSHTSTMKG